MMIDEKDLKKTLEELYGGKEMMKLWGKNLDDTRTGG